jgi:hypothetical protein
LSESEGSPEGEDKIKGHPTRRQVIWSLCSDPLLGRAEVTRTAHMIRKRQLPEENIPAYK